MAGQYRAILKQPKITVPHKTGQRSTVDRNSVQQHPKTVPHRPYFQTVPFNTFGYQQCAHSLKSFGQRHVSWLLRFCFDNNNILIYWHLDNIPFTSVEIQKYTSQCGNTMWRCSNVHKSNVFLRKKKIHHNSSVCIIT